MPNQARIVMVSRHPTVQWMFDAIEPMLTAAGHEVVRYKNRDDLVADPWGLANADVLLAAGQMSVS